ncbi:MAG: NAD(P)/FAD-dependent oxidoreductase [Geminicoccaceae bacterium]|nr:NAD(P)/FAD-dependent oxidoreductase [Geminicoccaceae bacterium]
MQVQEWLERFGRVLAAGDVEAAVSMFADDGYWRDLLAFTWNIETMEGRSEIEALLRATLDRVRPRDWRLERLVEDEDGAIEGWFTFETDVARCEGIVRLVDGRCHTLFTAMVELIGHEAPVRARRPLGVEHRADPKRETWTEERRRDARELGRTRQPYVVIVGGGQGGCALAARLKVMGVPALVIEKNPRIGDSWRNRYRTLVLHDPVWFDHLPYVPFPDNWPVFTPKDKMGDWLEMYARVMELDVWTDTACTAARFEPPPRPGTDPGAELDDAATHGGEGRWRVTVERPDGTVELRPAHLVFATGAYGPPRMIDLPGADRFEGDILHASAYADGAAWRGRPVVVVGSASSGHDVCVDLWENGARPTMVQRAPTTVIRSETLMDLAFASYSQAAVDRGWGVEEADKRAASVPKALQPEQQRRLTAAIRARDADFYERLAASGFAFDFGVDDSGLMMKAHRTGSGYYIDVGASQLIIDGAIGVKNDAGIERLEARAVRFTDGEEIEADAVICCTGYHSMHETVALIVSREAADRVGPCWGLGSGVPGDPGPWQRELRNMWKPTAHEALWFHGGNLALSRYYSTFLALQLAARMHGIPTPVHRAAP